jgi:hypothetical protein
LTFIVSFSWSFALSWRTSWKLFVYFSIWFEHMFDFHCFIFMIFYLCSFSCYNMVAKFLLSRLYLSCPCFYVLLIPAHNAYIYGQDCVGACHLKNYCFVITYLLDDEQELSLGMLIRLKRIYNFLCSMLVLHHLPCVLLHFMAFLCAFWN